MFKGLVRWKEKFKRHGNKWGHGILRETARAGPTLYKERQSLRKHTVIPLKIFKLLHFKIKFSDEKYHKWTRKENPREWSNLRVSFVSLLFDVPPARSTWLYKARPWLHLTMALSGWSFESGAHHTAAAGPSRHPTTAGRHLKRCRRVHSCLALGAERLVITMCPRMSDSPLVLCVRKGRSANSCPNRQESLPL